MSTPETTGSKPAKSWARESALVIGILYILLGGAYVVFDNKPAFEIFQHITTPVFLLAAGAFGQHKVVEAWKEIKK